MVNTLNIISGNKYKNLSFEINTLYNKHYVVKTQQIIQKKNENEVNSALWNESHKTTGFLVNINS
jgi:hypothetical protein